MEKIGIQITADGSVVIREFERINTAISTVSQRISKDSASVNAEMKKMAASSQEAANAVSRQGDLMAAAMTRVTAAFAAIATVASVREVAQAMTEAQLAAQKLRNSLEYSAGSAKGVAQELEYLRNVTRTLGLDFSTASIAYSKFAAATKESGISSAQTKTVFEGIAAASVKMGLSADETQGALLALSQMASKGVVSAEELRGQLGERLPGAFNIAAKAMGLTTAELGKLLESGQLMASDFLPKFGAALKNEFEAPLSSLSQEINRFNSAWTLWKQQVSEGTNGGGLKWLSGALYESEAAMKALGKEAGIVHKLLVAIGGASFGAIGFGKFDTARLQDDAMKDLTRVKSEIAGLQNLQGNLIAQGNLDRLREQEREIRTRLMDLAVQRGKAEALMPDIAGEFAKQESKRNEGLKKYLDDLKNAPKAVKVAAEIDAENKAFMAAVSGFSETDERYIKALTAHEARIKEIKNRGKEEKKETDYEKFNAEANKREAAMIAEAEAGRKLTEIDKWMLEVLVKVRDGKIKTTEAERVLIAARLEAIGMAEKQKTDEEEALQFARERAQMAAKDYSDTAKQLESKKQEVEAIGLTKEALNALTLSRIDERIAKEEAKALDAEGIASREAELSLIRENIAAMKELRAVTAKGHYRQAEADIEKEITDARKKGWEETDRFAREIFSSWAEGGSNAAEKIGKTLRSALLSAIYEATLRPVVFQVYTQAIGMLGGSVGGLSPQGAGIGSLGNLAGTGNSMYNAMSGGGIAGGFLSGMASAGSEAALGAAFVGPSASLAGGAIGAGAEVGALFGAAAGPIAAALPWIGVALAAASLFGGKRGGPKFEGAQGFNLSTGASFDDARLPDHLRGYTGNSADAQIEQLMKPLIAGLGTTLSAFGGKLAGDAQARFSMVRDPKGTADSFVGADLFVGGKKVYGSNNSYGRSDEDFQRGVELESKRLTLASIAFAEGINPIVQALLRGTDIANASLTEIDTAMARAIGANNLTTTIDKLRGGFSDLDVAFSDLLVGPAKDAFNLSLQDIGSFVTDAVTNITPDAATLNRVSIGFDEAGNEVFVTLGESITNAASTVLSKGVVDADAIRASLQAGLAPVFQDLLAGFDITTATPEQIAAKTATMNQTEALRQVFDKLGFGINNVTAAAVTGAHNLETFASNSAAYYQAITSPQKQVEDAMAALGKQFQNVGLTMPTTISGFTSLVDSLDKTTPEGMRMTEMLMALFPAFRDVTAAGEALRKETEAQAAATRQAMMEQARGNLNTQQLAGQLRGESPLVQAQRAQALAATQMESSLMILGKGFISLSEILAMSDGELGAWLDSLDAPTRQLVNTFLQASQTVQSATEQTAQATADKISEIRAATMGGIGNTQTGPTWFDAGTLKGIWAEQFGQWFGTAGEAMNRGGLDFGTSTERMIAMMRAELARQNARLGTEGVDQYGNHPAEQAMKVLQENIASLMGDLTKYQSYESQYSGKGKQLLELDKWRDGMLANAKGNQDAINAVLESYNDQFRKIVEGATEAAATASTAWADFKKSISDSLADIGLNEMERKIKSINDAYLDNLKKAQEAAKASGFGPGLTKDAQAKVDVLAEKGLNIRDTLDAKRAALLEAEQQQRALETSGGLGNGELAQRIATLRSEIASLTSDYTANQAALTAAREKLASLTAGSQEYAETLLNIEKLQAAQIAKLKAEFMAPISEALSTFDMSAYEKQIYEINKAYEKNMESARALGLSLNDLSQIESLHNKQLKKAAEDNLRSTYEAYKAHLEGIIAAKKTAEDALRSAYQQRAGEYQATIDKVKDAESALRSAYESKVSEIDATQKKFADFADSLKEFRQSLTMGEDGILSAADRYRAAFSLLQDTITRAKGGDETAYGKLQGQATDALGQAKNQASTRLEYLRDFARVDAALQDAEAAARGQSSVAEQQLAALKLQYGWLDTKGDQSIETALKTYEEAKLAGKVAQEQLDALKKQVGALIKLEDSTKSIEELIDEYLKAAEAADIAQKQLDELQKQVGALINIDTSINAQGAQLRAALEAAIASLAGIIGSGGTGSGGGAGTGGGGAGDPLAWLKTSINGMYETLLGRTADTAGLNYWLNDYNAGRLDLAGIEASIRASNEYQTHSGSGGGAGSDTYYANADGLPVAAAVETAQLMSRLMQPQQDNSALISEIQALREEVKAGNSAIAENTRDTAKVLKQFDGEGMPEVRA